MQTYSINTTGLIVVDLLNDFLSPDGKGYPLVRQVVEGMGLISKLQTLLDGARAKGIKVFYAPHRLNEQSFNGWRYLTDTAQRVRDYQIFWEGTWGAEYLSNLAPQPDDHLISPHKGASSFVSTDLDVQLRQNGIDHVVLAGMVANTCVEATGRYAVELGYHITFLKDAVAATFWEGQKAATEVNYPMIAHAVLTVDEFLAQLEKPVHDSQSDVES